MSAEYGQNPGHGADILDQELSSSVPIYLFLGSVVFAWLAINLYQKRRIADTCTQKLLPSYHSLDCDPPALVEVKNTRPYESFTTSNLPPLINSGLLALPRPTLCYELGHDDNLPTLSDSTGSPSLPTQQQSRTFERPGLHCAETLAVVAGRRRHIMVIEGSVVGGRRSKTM
jgi:hypothetical protein